MARQRWLVVGGGRGVGRALVDGLLARDVDVVATVRRPEDHADLAAAVEVRALDLEDPPSIPRALAGLERLDGLVNVAGLLHDGAMQPERRLEHVEPEHFARAFAVNATGPLLLARHAFPLLDHGGRAVLANLSARVGSIGDNRLGGWYAYRASKAAQNMITRTLSIELGRRAPGVIVVGLHPGTVATDLSAPFRRRAKRVFEPTEAAGHLLSVLDRLTPKASGQVFAWDGQPIPW